VLLSFVILSFSASSVMLGKLSTLNAETSHFWVSLASFLVASFKASLEVEIFKILANHC